MHHNQSRFFLSKHAYMCMTQGCVVFLDVKKDKYSVLLHDEALRISDAVAGWPVTTPDSTVIRHPLSEGEELLQELLDEGLITEEEFASKPASRVSLEEPTSDLGSLMLGNSAMSIRHAATVLAAWARITIELQCQSLENSIERVRLRKSRTCRSEVPVDLDKVRPLIASYFRLQPRLFSSYNTCLRNSLTLTEYLAMNGMYPTLVFGVHMEPWAAHSWVQDGSVVLNDTLQHVRRFTPILAI